MSRWYIIHAYSGFENKVRDAIMSEASRMGLTPLVEQIEVPTETVTEIKRGKRVRVLDNLSTGKMSHMDSFFSQIDFMRGDIRAFEDCQRAVEGAGRYVAVAAVAGGAPNQGEYCGITGDLIQPQ